MHKTSPNCRCKTIKDEFLINLQAIVEICEPQIARQLFAPLTFLPPNDSAALHWNALLRRSLLKTGDFAHLMYIPQIIFSQISESIEIAYEESEFSNPNPAEISLHFEEAPDCIFRIINKKLKIRG